MVLELFITVSIVGVLFALWVVCSPWIAEPLYNRVVFKPWKERGDPQVLAAVVEEHGGKDVYFYNKAGNRLHGLVLGNVRESSQLILFSIGRDGDIARRARTLELLLQPGVAVFIYEYSGFGTSQGKPSLLQLCQDSVAAFDYATWVLAKSASEIVLFGESFGGAVSAWLLNRTTARALILKSCFSSFVQICRELCFWIRIYPKAMFPKSRLDVVELLRSANKPVLVIHGHGDRMARWHHALRLQEASGGELVKLPNSRHAYTPLEDEELLRERVSSFLKRLKQPAEVAEKV